MSITRANILVVNQMKIATQVILIITTTMVHQQQHQQQQQQIQIMRIKVVLQVLQALVMLAQWL